MQSMANSKNVDAVVDPSTLAMLKMLHKLGAATAKISHGQQVD